MMILANADLRTYLGDPDLKASFLEEIGKHEQADMLRKGSYGNGIPDCGFKGCAIGCALHSLNKLQGKPPSELANDTGNHERYVTELGLPLWLAYMEDHIFESLPDNLSKTWPRRLAEAIPVGACVHDLVLAKILRWTLAAERFGARYATEDAAVVAVVDRIVALFDRTIRGDEPTSKEWDAARAAWDARAARAARAAWDAWAAYTCDAFYPALSEYVLSLLRELSALPPPLARESGQ